MATPTRASVLLDDANLGHAGVSAASRALRCALHDAYLHAKGQVAALKAAHDALEQLDRHNAEAIEACGVMRDLELVVDPAKRGAARKAAA